MSAIALDDSLWWRRFHSEPTGRPRLICFPHAGGSATGFHPLSAAMRDRVEVLALQYPGRQDRWQETPFDELLGLATELAAVVSAVRGPFAFFGHSMGAVLAFEVARQLAASGRPGPTTLFVSGRRAPSCYRDERAHLLDDRGLLAEVRSLSGTDDRVFDDEDLIALVLPALRADYRAIETYRYRPGPKLTCPIVALTGSADPRASVEEVSRWAEHSSAAFELNCFDGGHFYLNGQEHEVAEVIWRGLQRA